MLSGAIPDLSGTRLQELYLTKNVLWLSGTRTTRADQHGSGYRPVGRRPGVAGYDMSGLEGALSVWGNRTSRAGCRTLAS